MPRASLLRFAEIDGKVVADVTGRAPGRGLWLSPRRDMIETAAARRLFTRVRGWNRISVPGDLAKLAEAAVLRHCLDLLGLARRAGEASVEAGDGTVAVVVETADAESAFAGEAVKLTLPAGTPLGRAVGEPGCRRVAIATGTFAERIVTEAERLSGFGGIKVERTNVVGTAEAGYGAT